MSSTRNIGFLKKAWHEMPDIVGSTFMACVGLALGGIGIVIYNQKQGDIRKYKFEYTVIRSDDPDVEVIRAKKEGRL